MSDDPDKPWRLPNAKRMTFDDMAARAQYEWQRAEDAEAEVKHQADRIEELEAKLARAVGALGDIYDGEPEWPDEPEKELEWCRNRAKRAIAELNKERSDEKGRDDE